MAQTDPPGPNEPQDPDDWGDAWWNDPAAPREPGQPREMLTPTPGPSASLRGPDALLDSDFTSDIEAEILYQRVLKERANLLAPELPPTIAWRPRLILLAIVAALAFYFPHTIFSIFAALGIILAIRAMTGLLFGFTFSIWWPIVWGWVPRCPPASRPRLILFCLLTPLLTTLAALTAAFLGQWLLALILASGTLVGILPVGRSKGEAFLRQLPAAEHPDRAAALHYYLMIVFVVAAYAAWSWVSLGFLLAVVLIAIRVPMAYIWARFRHRSRRQFHVQSGPSATQDRQLFRFILNEFPIVS
ncbi:MAG: hypothetical protein ACRCZF_14530, partial [Gemmataceae bacterium]